MTVPGPFTQQSVRRAIAEAGAVDLDACPTRDRLHRCRCKLRCQWCGFRKHTAVHGPVFGQLPGSKPYDHQFELRCS